MRERQAFGARPSPPKRLSTCGTEVTPTSILEPLKVKQNLAS